MITEIIELNNNKIFRIMKTFLYFTPIGIIVFKFLKNYYPDLDFYLSSDISTINVKYAILYFFIFSVSCFFTLLLEKIILPVFIFPRVPKLEKIKLLLDKKVSERFEKLNIKNPYELPSNTPKIEIYNLLCSVSILLILWFSVINSWLVLIPILIVIAFSIFLASVINTLVK